MSSDQRTTINLYIDRNRTNIDVDIDTTKMKASIQFFSENIYEEGRARLVFSGGSFSYPRDEFRFIVNYPEFGEPGPNSYESIQVTPGERSHDYMQGIGLTYNSYYMTFTANIPEGDYRRYVWRERDGLCPIGDKEITMVIYPYYRSANLELRDLHLTFTTGPLGSLYVEPPTSARLYYHFDDRIGCTESRKVVPIDSDIVLGLYSTDAYIVNKNGNALTNYDHIQLGVSGAGHVDGNVYHVTVYDVHIYAYGMYQLHVVPDGGINVSISDSYGNVYRNDDYVRVYTDLYITALPKGGFAYNGMFVNGVVQYASSYYENMYRGLSVSAHSRYLKRVRIGSSDNYCIYIYSDGAWRLYSPWIFSNGQWAEYSNI